MVARNSLAFRIEKCDGHGLRGLTATGKKNPRHQDSSHDQMSEAMGCKPTPFRAVHHTTHRLDPDENGISFPRLCNVRHKRLECDPRTPLDFPRLHGEMLAEIAGGKNASLGRTRALDPSSPGCSNGTRGHKPTSGTDSIALRLILSDVFSRNFLSSPCAGAPSGRPA